MTLYRQEASALAEAADQLFRGSPFISYMRVGSAGDGRNVRASMQKRPCSAVLGSAALQGRML